MKTFWNLNNFEELQRGPENKMFENPWLREWVWAGQIRLFLSMGEKDKGHDGSLVAKGWNSGRDPEYSHILYIQTFIQS